MYPVQKKNENWQRLAVVVIDGLHPQMFVHFGQQSMK